MLMIGDRYTRQVSTFAQSVVANDSGRSIVYNLCDIARAFVWTTLVWIMATGLGFFYTGLLSVMAFAAVVSFEVSPSNIVCWNLL